MAIRHGEGIGKQVLLGLFLSNIRRERRMGRNKHLDACGQLLFVVVLAINKRGVDGEAKRDQALAPSLSSCLTVKSSPNFYTEAMRAIWENGE